jgi:hypothetical protein
MQNLNSCILRISENKHELLINNLVENGFKVYTLNGKNISNVHNFFQEAIKVLPQNPPLKGRTNLDAFADSIWGGMDEVGYDKVAIIWEKSNYIINKSPNDLSKIIQCFEELSDSFKTVEYGLDKPIILKVFLLGSGDAFNEDFINTFEI